MAVDWKKSSYNASMRLWRERICLDPTLPYLPFTGIETIIKGIHESYNDESHILISLVDKYFHDDINFRKFAFTTTGEDQVDISNIALQFTSHSLKLWTAEDLYKMWTNLVESDRNYIDENAARHGYFVDIFIAFPEFETLDLSERESYVSNALNFLVRCSSTRQGFKRPSIRRWLDPDGRVAIKWCLNELSSPNVDMESLFTLHQTLLAFYGAQSAKIGHPGYELFGDEQHILIAEMLERMSTKDKYTEVERGYFTKCLKIMKKES